MDPLEVIPPPVPVPTCEELVGMVIAALSGLPTDRSGPVSWDHVAKKLYVPTI